MTNKWKEPLRIVAWLTLGLIVGIGLGLFTGWVVWPAEFSDADPTVLDDSYQRDYTLMIAATYSLDEDLPAARSRLRSLGMEDSDEWLLGITVDHILNGGDQLEIRQLVKLADALGLSSPAMVPYLPDAPTDGGL